MARAPDCFRRTGHYDALARTTDLVHFSGNRFACRRRARGWRVSSVDQCGMGVAAMRGSVFLLVLVSVTASPGVAAEEGGAANEAQFHPGRMGYLQSGGAAGGVPIAHRYTGSGGPAYVPFAYPDGAGGWGGAVSALMAECGGVKGVHEPDCDPDAAEP